MLAVEAQPKALSNRFKCLYAKKLHWLLMSKNTPNPDQNAIGCRQLKYSRVLHYYWAGWHCPTPVKMPSEATLAL